jgi:hypothetical protein
MIVYQTDNEGNYVGETTADKSPLENGVFLVPRGAVLQAPPTHDSNTHRAKWSGSSWLLEERPPLVEPPPPPPPAPPPQLTLAELQAQLEALAAQITAMKQST